MKLGLVGPSYVERSIPFDAQRCINLFPTLNETGGGKEVAALYGTPGLLLFSEIGAGPIRGEFASANGRAFVVSGSGLYEVFSNGASTLLGTLDGSSSICSITENVTQLVICDGAVLYTLTYSSNVFAKVTDVDLPGAATVTFQDQYIIVNRPDTGEFYISDQGDATAWAALDFSTAESSPDKLVRVFSAYGQLWLLGVTTTEVWYNSGDSTFPFARIEGAKMQQGCIAPHSVVDMDNTIFWLGQDKDGKGIVYAASGYSASRISTHAIEFAIRQATDMSMIRGYSYQEDGHLFYALTGGGLATTLVYDAATKLWHERAYLEADGSLSTHRATCHMFAFGKHLVGDKSEGKIYEQSLDYFDDNGDEIRRQRVFTHLHNNGKRFNANNIQVGFETGVGLTTGQGSVPVCWLETSNNGGRTWGPELQASIGAKGEYEKRVVWRRLGQFTNMTPRLTITDPVKVAICGAYLNDDL